MTICLRGNNYAVCRAVKQTGWFGLLVWACAHPMDFIKWVWEGFSTVVIMGWNNLWGFLKLCRNPPAPRDQLVRYKATKASVLSRTLQKPFFVVLVCDQGLARRRYGSYFVRVGSSDRHETGNSTQGVRRIH